jgi:hypothetical protein
MNSALTIWTMNQLIILRDTIVFLCSLLQKKKFFLIL